MNSDWITGCSLGSPTVAVCSWHWVSERSNTHKPEGVLESCWSSVYIRIPKTLVLMWKEKHSSKREELAIRSESK